jgi:hypothetical protein
MTPEVEKAMLHNLRVRFRAALQAQKGHKGGYWARGEDGSWISIGFWKNREAMVEGGRHANSVPLLPGQRSELIPSPRSVEIYNVVEGDPPASSA